MFTNYVNFSSINYSPLAVLEHVDMLIMFIYFNGDNYNTVSVNRRENRLAVLIQVMSFIVTQRLMLLDCIVMRALPSDLSINY